MKLTKEQHDTLVNWIQENLIPVKTYNKDYSTGTIRSSFEHSENGFYLDDPTFNKIMLECGYEPLSDKDDFYWYFKVSRKSPAFTEYLGRD